MKPEKARIGWREWITMPALQIGKIKAKVDTGARSSALHAVRVKTFDENGQTFVSFDVHPFQRDSKTVISCKAKLLEYRKVKSSVGHVTKRPVIETEIEWMGQRWTIELTLVNRELMGFRMLLGREAIRGKFLVDAGISFIGGRPKKKRKRKRNRSAHPEIKAKNESQGGKQT